MSAAPRVRDLCLPELVAGMEIEVKDDEDHIKILALLKPLPFLLREPEDPSAEVPTVWLTGRATGRTYRGLSWWEVDRG